MKKMDWFLIVLLNGLAVVAAFRLSLVMDSLIIGVLSGIHDNQAMIVEYLANRYFRDI